MGWLQKEIRLRAKARGFHLVTHEIVQQVAELKAYKVGLAHIFIKHTSASLALRSKNEVRIKRGTKFKNWRWGKVAGF